MHDLPAAFGTWDQFAADWFLDAQVFPRDETTRCLAALGRHLPEKVQALVSGGCRAPYLIMDGAEIGRVLLATEGLTGFAPVLARFKGGEVAAYSELLAAASLAEAQFDVSLEPFLGNNKLDMLIGGFSMPIYIEVVAPQKPEAISRAYDAAQAKGLEELQSAPHGEVVSFEFCVPFDDRGRSKIEEKRKQLTAGECNIVMVNMAEVDEPARWLKAMPHVFQPTKNTRISAVIFWETKKIPHYSIVHRATIVANPHASVPLPEEFRTALLRMSEV